MTRRSAIVGLAASSLFLPACRTEERSLDADVLVMGAGLSGLYAARMLEEAGLDVLVVEALDRVGGRMFTLDHEDGITEGGGQQIGASYARLLDVAANLKVPLYSETGPPPRTSHYLQGQWMADEIEVPEFPEPFRTSSPSSVLFRLLAREPALESYDSWLTADPSFDISAAEFLTQKGFSDAAQALIGRALNANNLTSYSMLNLHRTMQLYRQSSGMGATQYVEGGSQRLPEAMADSLSRPVRTGTPISAVSLRDGLCEVETPQGVLRATYGVCTLPFPALRKIKGLSFAESSPLGEAIRELPYTQIMQFHMRTLSPFWETDNLAPSMWTDSEVERVFADTDREGQLTGFHRGWVNGDGVEAWSNLPNPVQAYLDRLAQIRPVTEGALERLARVDWTQNNPYAGGAYYHWKPSQAQRLAGKMGEPIGNLHFAGEHLGLLSTGMEAAMESGERAALQIIERTA